MEQELIKKKREIIGTFLKKGILISSELLKEIDNADNISGIIDALQARQTDDILTSIIPASQPTKITAPGAEAANEEQQEQKVKVVYSYREEPKKREPQDFVDYFNSRYKAIEKILKQRQ